jgi:ADP-ribose pyrophosphatase YjhB (NUDIX family)
LPAHAPASHERLDALYRWFYRAAYIVMRLFWFVFRPLTRGVNVALWHADELLVVRNAYRPGYTLPGGYIRFQEKAREAAVRELREELQLTIAGADLIAWGQIEIRQDYRRDRVTIFEMHCAARPVVRLDNREVVAACFLKPAAVVPSPHAAPLAAYLAAKRTKL